METSAHDHALSVFVGVRPRLFGIAYRMLGRAAEAEDFVQDVWLRWQAANRSVVLDPPAFLATTTTRLAINHDQSARSRRETYVGPWLPEPVDTSADPLLGAERGGFDAPRKALADGASRVCSPGGVRLPIQADSRNPSTRRANTRQLVARARKHIADGRRALVRSAEQRRLLEAFIAAAQEGDVSTLGGLFASDIASYSDGGGMVRAARVPICGRDRVTKFIASFASHF